MKKLLLFGILVFSMNSFAQGPVPFNCQNCSSESFYQVHSSSPPPTESVISLIDITNDVYAPLQNSPGSIVMNAVGMNPADSLGYGIRWTTNELIQVDALGDQVNLGAVTNLPVDFYDAGDFGPDGFLHVRYDNGQTMYKIDVETNTVVGSYIFSTSIEPNDFALNTVNNLFYSVNNSGELFTIDPMSGLVNTIGASGLSGDFGAIFSDNTGRVWALQNATGNLYQFDTNNGSASLATTLTSAAYNDGFSCSNAISSFEFNEVIQVDEITLMSDVDGAQYQWIDCNNNKQPVVGETNQTFTATYNSDFAVIAEQDGCQDTSECMTINTVGTEELNLGDKELIRIVDLLGREVPFEKNRILIYVYSDGTTERVFDVE